MTIFDKRPPIARPPIARPPIARPPIARPPIARPPIARPTDTKKSCALKSPHTFKMVDGVVGDAAFVEIDGAKHRLWLTRQWASTPGELSGPNQTNINQTNINQTNINQTNQHGEINPHEPFVLFIGANPSTAAGDVDDMTIRKEISFTAILGRRSMVKVNVATYCATDPADLATPNLTLSMFDNLPAIVTLARSAATIVIATGDLSDSPLYDNAIKIFHALISRGYAIKCFGATASGWPRHTSRLAYSTPLITFNASMLERIRPKITQSGLITPGTANESATNGNATK